MVWYVMQEIFPKQFLDAKARYVITLHVDTDKPLLLFTAQQEEHILQKTELINVCGFQWLCFFGRQTDAHDSQFSSVCGRKEQELGDTSLL